MFIGILIGIFLWGLFVLFSNTTNSTGAIILRVIAWAAILIGGCGAVGWFLHY